MSTETIIITIAVLFFLGSIAVGFTTQDSWKSTGITWGLLAIGITLFSIALTL